MTATKQTIVLDDITRWPPAVSVSMAALAFGISRAKAYELITAGTFPATAFQVGKKWKVSTASILERLAP